MNKMQKELFKDFTAYDEAAGQPAAKNASFFESFRLTLTLDKLILAFLVNMTAGIVLYSYALERGVETGVKKAASGDSRTLTIPVPAQVAPAAKSGGEIAAAGGKTMTAGEAAVKKDVAETVASVPATKEAALSNGNYTIQLVTYAREDRAKKEVERLMEKGHHAFIIPSGKFFQVCIDRFEVRADASDRLSKLKSAVDYRQMYGDAYVRPVKP